MALDDDDAGVPVTVEERALIQAFAAETIRHVEKLAANNPLHVDPRSASGLSCKYGARADTEGCIFGQAFTAQGIPTETLGLLDHNNDAAAIAVAAAGYTAANVPVPDAYRSRRGLLPGKVITWMNDVQRRQDGGATWRNAVAHACWEGGFADINEVIDLMEQ